jgi:putative transposase
MPWGLKRFQYTGESHFVTFCCYHRRPLLTALESRRLFESGIFELDLERVRRKFRLRVYGYVIMPEHVHLLLSEPQGEEQSTGVPFKPSVGLSGTACLADALKSLKQ